MISFTKSDIHTKTLISTHLGALKKRIRPDSCNDLSFKVSQHLQPLGMKTPINNMIFDTLVAAYYMNILVKSRVELSIIKAPNPE
jgi:hypothetical protein